MRQRWIRRKEVNGKRRVRTNGGGGGRDQRTFFACPRVIPISVRRSSFSSSRRTEPSTFWALKVRRESELEKFHGKERQRSQQATKKTSQSFATTEGTADNNNNKKKRRQRESKSGTEKCERIDWDREKRGSFPPLARPRIREDPQEYQRTYFVNLSDKSMITRDHVYWGCAGKRHSHWNQWSSSNLFDFASSSRAAWPALFIHARVQWDGSTPLLLSSFSSTVDLSHEKQHWTKKRRSQRTLFHRLFLPRFFSLLSPFYLWINRTLNLHKWDNCPQ